MFDLENLMTTTAFNVCSFDLTIQDRRSGQVYKRTAYRPGKCYPALRVHEEYEKYGYKVLSIGEPADVPGTIDWSKVFEIFTQQEEE